jgi:hypothetical protein
MKTSTFKDSKFLRKEDCDPAILLTITGFEQCNVAMNDQPEELKWCMVFAEAKNLVMNAINTQICEKVFGSDETDDWISKKIVAYNDPMVSYGGKLVGGIRLRAPKTRTAQVVPQTQAVAAPAKPVAPPMPEPPDDIDEGPFDNIPF